MRFADKPEAKEISWKLWQASGVTANVRYLALCNPYGKYDTIGEFNVDWKAEYSALSSTRSQKKKLKQPTPVPL